MPFDPTQPYEVVSGFDPNQPYEVVTPQKGRSVLDVVKDTGIDAAKGVIELGRGAVGVADLATGNLAGKGLSYLGYDPDAAVETLSEGYSEPRKEANRNVAEAEGFFGTLEALVDNPSVAFGSIVESAPMSLGAVAAARAVALRMLGAALAENGIAAGSTAAKEFAATFFKQPAVQSSIVRAGAAVEGAQTAGSIQERARAEGRDWSDSAIPAIAAGAGTAAIGLVSSKIPGFRDAEATVATAGLTARDAGEGVVNRVTGSAKEIGKSMVKEGAFEEMPQSGQEEWFSNQAMGTPGTEGVPEAMAQGLVVGAAQGGGMMTVSEALKAIQPAQVLPIDKTKPSNMGVIAANISEADREHAEQTAMAEQMAGLDKAIDGIDSRVAGKPVDFSKMKELPANAFTANRGKPFVSESALRANARVKGVDLAGHEIVPFGGGFVAVPPQATEEPAKEQPKQEETQQDGTGDDIPDWSMNAQGPKKPRKSLKDNDPFSDDYDPDLHLKHRIDDMEGAIRGQNDRESLDAIYDDIMMTVEKRPELQPFAEQLHTAYSEHAASIEGTVKAEAERSIAEARKTFPGTAGMSTDTEAGRAVDDKVNAQAAVRSAREKGLMARYGLKTFPPLDPSEETPIPATPAGSAEKVEPYNESEARKKFPGTAGMSHDTDGGRLVDTKVEAQSAVRASKEKALMAKFGLKAIPPLHTGGNENAEIDNGKTQEGDERDHVPNAERHEVVDNAESAAHAQVVNTAPSEAQKEAGNYKKAHVNRDGLDISIENPTGSKRSGTDPSGKKWEIEMKTDYGYIKGSQGYDKDHVDVFLSPGYQGGAQDAYVVNQYKDGGKGEFDEHKVVIGATSEAQALSLYNANYEAGWSGGKYVTRMPMEDFKAWVKSEGPKDGALIRNTTQAAHGIKQAERNAFTGSKKEAALAQLRRRVGDERKEFPGVAGAGTVEPANVRTSEAPNISGPATVKDSLTAEADPPGAETVTGAVSDGGSQPALIEHTTKRGKVIKGIVRTDLTHAEALSIDKYTFKKDGGWFIREEHLSPIGHPQGKKDGADRRAGGIIQNSRQKHEDFPGWYYVVTHTTGPYKDRGKFKATFLQEKPDGSFYPENGFGNTPEQALDNAMADLRESQRAKRAKESEEAAGVSDAGNTTKDDVSGISGAGNVTKDKVSGITDAGNVGENGVSEAQQGPEWFDDNGELTLAGAREQLGRFEDQRREFERGEIAKGRVPIFDARKEQKIREAKRLVEQLEAEQAGTKKDEPVTFVIKSLQTGKEEELTLPPRGEAEEAKAEPLSTLEQVKALTEDDLNSLFDEVEQDRARAKEKKARQARERATTGRTSDPATPKTPRAPRAPRTRTAKDIAKEGGIAANTAVKEAMTGLAKLFGDPNTLRSGPAFDEETYRKAKPHFVAAWNEVKNVGYSAKELIQYFYESFGDKIRPYLMRFMRDLQEDNLDVDTGKNSLTDKTGRVKTKDGQIEEAGGIVSQNSGTSNINSGDKDNGNLATRDDKGTVEDDRGGTGRDIAQGVSPHKDGREGSPGISRTDGKTADGGIPSGNDRDGARGAGNEAVTPGAAAADKHQDKDGMGSGVVAASGVSGIAVPSRARDYRIPAGGIDREGSWWTTARRNIEIIELAKKLEQEGRQATTEEQELLAKYTGFGATEIANNLFPGYARHGKIVPSYARDDRWRELAERLDNLLTPAEMKTAARSTQYAHYTSEAIINSIYKALDQFGFKGGKVLEPGAGVSSFWGLMPTGMHGNSKYTGIEMDHVTALIAKQLYPEQSILHADFTKQKLPGNFFDLAIGNPPFSDTKITSDPVYKKNKFFLHDYFFAKSVDKVRPGGLLVFVTSKGTMNKANDAARQYLAERADLLGAIRLPQTAFKQHSGTEVVTDILFFKKRVDGEPAAGESWLGLSEVETAEGPTLVNEYFAAHPEMVLGTHSLKGSMYRADEYTVLPHEGDIEEQFAQAVKNLPKGVYEKAVKRKAAQAPARVKVEEVVEHEFNPVNRKEGGIYLNSAGKLMRVQDGAGTTVTESSGLNAKQMAWLKDYVPLRDALKKAQYDQLNDLDWESSLKALNEEYDKFVGKHGRILDNTTTERVEVNEDGDEVVSVSKRYKNKKVMNYDVESPAVRALEKEDDHGNITKGPFLTGRTIQKPVRQKPATLADAMALVLDEYGYLDIDSIAESLDVSRQEAIDGLDTLIFENPDTGKWEARDEYLSGDVKEKLAIARAAADSDVKYRRNVEALESTQPSPLKAEDVTIKLGAPWVRTKIVEQFADDVLGIRVRIKYDSSSNYYTVDLLSGSPQRGRGDTDGWATAKRSSYELLDSVLNNRTIKVTMSDGKKTVTDQVGTVEANAVADKIRARFSSWVWEDAGRAGELLDLYNEQFNNLAGRKFDGSHLTLPGVSLRFNLHPHQKNAIWRIIQTGNTYVGHAVGAGKTMVMIAAGMEMRRLGLVRKPIYVVPKHMLNQFSNEFVELYPLANIMVADEENFHTDNRRNFIAQAALNNPDAVIITHSSLKKLGMSEESINVVADELISELRSAKDDMENDDKQKNRYLIKRIENRIEKLEQMFAGMVSQERDKVMTFEELGADFLFVDEAHEFRKLDFATNRQAKGIDSSGSQAAIDLFIKTRWLSRQRPGRSHVFASGTPVTNTMGELFNLMRFFIDEEMKKEGINHFDAWASMFGEVTPGFERNAVGAYQVVERFAKFVNVPELMSRVRSFMDVLTFTDLGAFVKRPSIQGGMPEMVLAKQSEALTNYLKGPLTERLEASMAWKPTKDEPHNLDPIINIISDGRLASIDMRFVVPSMKDDPGSKLNKMIDGIIDTWKSTKDLQYTVKGSMEMHKTRGATQIVFFNLGFGSGVKGRGFDARAWVMTRLKDAGIPANQIGWMEDANTAAKKKQLFSEMNTGAKRILIGSAKQMGTGVNVQHRLHTLHYLDSPWYPADVEQPMGRIIRQGNQHEEVRACWYATEGSYDSTMWQMVARKSKFTEQAFSGDSSVRTMEDVSASSQYEMATAISSGDSRVMQLAGLRNDIERLEMLKIAHRDNQRRMGSDKWRAESNIKYANERIKHLIEATKKVGGYIREWSGNIDGTVFDKRAELGAAIQKKVADIKASLGEYKKLEYIKKDVGTINGFKLVAAVNSTDQTKLYVVVTRNVMAEVNPEGDPGGLVTRIANFINGVHGNFRDTELEVEQYKGEIAKYEKRLGAPFEHAAELKEKIAEAKRLETELLADGKGQPAPSNGLLIAMDEGMRLEQGWSRRNAIMFAKPVSSNRVAWAKVGANKDGDTAKLSVDKKPLSAGEAADVQGEIEAASAGALIESGDVELLTPEDAQKIAADKDADVKHSSDGRIVGIVSKGKVYLIQGNIRKGEAWNILVHETGVHVGQVLANDDEFKAILAMVADRREEQSATGEAIRKAFAKVPKDTRPEYIMEEALAYLVQDHPETSIVRRLIALVKKVLVKLGLPVGIYTAADLRALAEVAVTLRSIKARSGQLAKNLADGREGLPVAAGLHFSKDGGTGFTPEELNEALAGGSITFLRNKKPDSTFLDRIFSTPEYYFKKFPAAGRVLAAALARRDVRFIKEKEILNGRDKDGNISKEGFVEFIQNLRKTNKEAYAEANEYLLSADREATGFRIKPSTDEESWQVKAPKWARKQGEDEVIGTFDDETEAIEAMIAEEGQAMAEHGYSDAAVEAVKMARELTNRGFDIMAADMRKIIAEARENGLPDPFVGDGQIDEAGRYAIYAAGKKMPIALFASEAEAEAMLKQAAEMIAYVVVGSRKGGERSFKTELQARKWAERHSGTVKGQPMFANLVVKKRTDAEMRPLTVKQALAQIGDLRGIYFPRIREAGEYVLIAQKEGENPIRKHFDIPTVGDGKPKLQKFLAMVTPIGREAKRLKAAGYTVTIKKDDSPGEDVFEATNLVSSLDAILQDSMKVIDKNSDTQVRSGQHINQILTMQIADIFKSRGYLSSRIRRKEGDDVWEGYEEDMAKALIQYGKNVAAGTAKRDTARAMILAFSGRDYSWAQYKQEVEDPDWTEYQEIVEKRRIDPRTQKNLFRDVRTFMVDVLRNDEQADRIMGVMKGLAVLKYLGFRISSAAVNVTNMVQGVPATLAGHTGEPLHKVFGRVTAAAMAYGKYRSGKGDLSEADKDIFRYISEHGWDEAQFNYEAARELRSKLGESWNKFMVASMFMFGAAEKANRAMTLFAAYKAVREKEKTAEEAVIWEKAKEISDRAHGIYGKETIPAWARGKLNPLRLTYTFQKFGHNYMLNMLDLGFNKKEYKVAAYMLLSPALLAGAGASLAGPALFALAGAFGIGCDDPEEKWYEEMEKMFGAGEFARHGLFGLAGINIKGSLSMNLPMPADIGNAKLSDLAGPAGGVLTDTGKGLAHLLNGEVAKGVEFLLPTAFGSMSKAAREATEGITTSNYGTVFYGDEPLRADSLDAFLRFMSFNPARLSGIREKQWNEKEVATKYQEEKSEIYAKIKRLRLQGRSITPEILKAIQVYNDRVAASGRGDLSPITPKTIKTMLRRNETASKVERLRVAR